MKSQIQFACHLKSVARSHFPSMIDYIVLLFRNADHHSSLKTGEDGSGEDEDGYDEDLGECGKGGWCTVNAYGRRGCGKWEE